MTQKSEEKMGDHLRLQQEFLGCDHAFGHLVFSSQGQFPMCISSLSLKVSLAPASVKDRAALGLSECSVSPFSKARASRLPPTGGGSICHHSSVGLGLRAGLPGPPRRGDSRLTHRLGESGLFPLCPHFPGAGPSQAGHSGV